MKRLNDDIAFWHWARARQAKGGSSWSSYWATLISATVEDAAPTHVVLTFPTAQTSLGASDFTIAGFTVSSASWEGAVLTLVLTIPVSYYEGNLTITFGLTGTTAVVTNNVAVADHIAWFDFSDASTITKDVNNYISQWRDKLASGTNLAQATGGVQPLLTEDGVDCYPDTTGRWMKTGTTVVDSAQPHNVFILCKVKTNGDNRYFFDGDANNSHSIYTATTNVRAFAGTSTFGTQAMPTANTWLILQVCFNGASSFVKVNDVDAVTGSTGTSLLTAITLNARSDGSFTHQGVYKEIIIQGNAGSETSDLAIREYLKKKYE